MQVEENGSGVQHCAHFHHPRLWSFTPLVHHMQTDSYDTLICTTLRRVSDDWRTMCRSWNVEIIFGLGSRLPVTTALWKRTNSPATSITFFDGSTKPAGEHDVLGKNPLTQEAAAPCWRHGLR